MVSEETMTLDQVKQRLRSFVSEREWEKYNIPKDLTLALFIEVAEVLEHFRFKSEAEIKEYLKSPQNKEKVAHELADCLAFLMRVSDVCDIDLAQAFERKMQMNAKKYPAEKFKGNYKKYDKAE